MHAFARFSLSFLTLICSQETAERSNSTSPYGKRHLGHYLVLQLELACPNDLVIVSGVCIFYVYFIVVELYLVPNCRIIELSLSLSTDCGQTRLTSVRVLGLFSGTVLTHARHSCVGTEA